MMTKPRQPKDHPPAEDKPAARDEHAPGGVPPEASDDTPKGMPHSDRHETETVANKA